MTVPAPAPFAGRLQNKVAIACGRLGVAITGTALVIDGGLTSFMTLAGHRPLEGI